MRWSQSWFNFLLLEKRAPDWINTLGHLSTAEAIGNKEFPYMIIELIAMGGGGGGGGGAMIIMARFDMVAIDSRQI